MRKPARFKKIVLKKIFSNTIIFGIFIQKLLGDLALPSIQVQLDFTYTFSTMCLNLINEIIFL